MEYRELGETGLMASVIGLGTWVMGGWMWGGAEDRESLGTLRRAIDMGINLIDTAPIYAPIHPTQTSASSGTFGLPGRSTRGAL